MQELLINKLENAYGINKLRVSINNNKKLNQNLIYSKNGTFKTSFSRTLYKLNNGEDTEIKDRISNIPANIDIKILDNGDEINDLKGKFLVFSREIYERKNFSNYGNELERLTINNKEKDYIEELINDNSLEVRLSLESQLKQVGIKYDDVIGLFEDENKGYLDWLIDFLRYIEECPERDVSDVNFKKIFQKPYNIIDDENFQTKVSDYLEVVENKLKVELFDDDFDHNNCLDFLKSVEKNSFLSKEKRRAISINGNDYYSLEELQHLFNDAIKKVSENPEVISKSQELLKTMGTSQVANDLRKSLRDNPSIIKQLSYGRKEIIRSYLKNTNINYLYYIEILEKTKKEVEKILKDAQSKKSLFETAIDIYQKRFKPVFSITLENKAESMLGLEVPSIVFHHNRNEKVVISEGELYDILSSGEKTTLNILKFIVEYEVAKANKPFIVLDDIVETFDYANRYAFIEYINDLIKDDVPVIVLTHNFEFYRTLSSRLKIVNCVAISDDKGVVEIQKNGNILRKIETIKQINNDNELVFAIPFCREARIILNENTDLLTNCLHYKEETSKIKIGDIIDCLDLNLNFIVDKNQLYIDYLLSVSDRIRNFDTFDLVKKTVLSVACRVFLEKKIVNNNFSLIEDVTENQTNYLLNTFRNSLSDDTIDLLEQVQLSTPEFIHANAFMYEPLVDIEGKYLSEIYEKIKNLKVDSIWKK